MRHLIKCLYNDEIELLNELLNELYNTSQVEDRMFPVYHIPSARICASGNWKMEHILCFGGKWRSCGFYVRVWTGGCAIRRSFPSSLYSVLESIFRHAVGGGWSFLRNSVYTFVVVGIVRQE